MLVLLKIKNVLTSNDYSKKKKTDQAGQTDQSSWSQQLQQSDDYISSELQKPGMVIRT